MKRHRIRFLVLVLLLALGATSLFGNPDQETYTSFYTDATLTTCCGYFYVTCNGVQRGGCVTEYSQTLEGPICWP